MLEGRLSRARPACTHRVIEDLEVARVFHYISTAVNMGSEHVIVHLCSTEQTATLRLISNALGGSFQGDPASFGPGASSSKF
jgi:hypothetical protein